jgi:RNA polymerase sigma factor (sigma-70 family)
MGAGTIQGVVEHLRRAALAAQSDRQLLDAVSQRREAAAFAALLERHGPMVLGVCRRVLGNEHDAEDAFQSTFLILIRKAAAVQKPESIGSWLYGVAYLTARKARVGRARRRAAEARACRPTQVRAEIDFSVDDELSAIPKKYRTPIVLCDLEGRSRKEAATLLGIAEGTLSSRLAAARKMLANRLRRRGLAPLAVLPARLSDALRSATVKTATSFLTGRGFTGAVRPEVITLSNGVVKTMFMNRLKTLAGCLLLLGLFGGGTGGIALRALSEGSAVADEPADAARRAAEELAAAEAAQEQAREALMAARARVAAKKSELRRAQSLDSLRSSAQPGAGPDLDAQLRKIATLFKYRVPVEIGQTDTRGGGRIQILDVWGTRPEIAVGGSYLVHGKYDLPSHERGRLYFHLSASDPRMAVSYDSDLQSASVQRGEREFTLVHSMVGPGYFHLQLEGADSGQSPVWADVYFGTGDNVLRRR